jgi:hypothetical protein
MTSGAPRPVKERDGGALVTLVTLVTPVTRHKRHMALHTNKIKGLQALPARNMTTTALI